MSVYGKWETATISAGGVVSTAVVFERDYDVLSLIIPGMDECSLQLQVAEKAADTYKDLGENATTNVETFDRGAIWLLGGWKYIKIVASAPQSEDRAIRVRGMSY